MAKSASTRCICSLFTAFTDIEVGVDEQPETEIHETTGCNGTDRQGMGPAKIFLAGHDAKVKGLFIRAGRNGHQVAMDGGGVTISADAVTMSQHLPPALAAMVVAGINRPAKAAKEPRAKVEKATPVRVWVKDGRWFRTGLMIEGPGAVGTIAVDGMDKTIRVSTEPAVAKVSTHWGLLPEGKTVVRATGEIIND